MKSKKANWSIELAVKAAVLLIFLFAMWGVINLIFINKEVVYANVQAESITKDCDGDEAIGVTDQCPCNDAVKTLKKGEKCPAATEISKTNCPAACK